jgi:mono/diheme cytochrome c family protein
MTSRLVLSFAVLALAAGVAGCRGGTKTEPQIGWIRNMHEVPRYDPQEPSPYFRDGRAMRMPVENTLSREMTVDPVIDTGVEDSGEFVSVIPEAIVSEAGGMENLVYRGRDRYNIYCVPCHGGLGDGNGSVPNRAGLLRPPSLHDDVYRTAPDGRIYATIRNGVRSMPSYRHAIPMADRWAIVSYVRALQLSQLDRGPTASLDRGAVDPARVPQGGE